jgi:allantoicase
MDNNTIDPLLIELASSYVNLASPRFGTKVVFATDDFFAAKERMIQDHDAVWKEDVYDDNGKWMDGWESRRRRDGGRDHAIVKLGSPGIIKGADIDTSYFTGNYPPAASLEACLSDEMPGDDAEWEEILTPQTLGPSAHHAHKIDDPCPYNWVRVNMFPDGGIARLRLYGEAYCDWQNRDHSQTYELSALKNGGRVVGYNNAHYGNTWALLSEGRGADMGDGWETRRRREPGNDWIIVKLGHAGEIEDIEVDTAHFKGNFPDGCSIDAAHVDGGTDASVITQSMFWKELMPRQKLSADTIHKFSKADLNEIGPITHVRLNIYPDGGISRLRLFGKPTGDSAK